MLNLLRRMIKEKGQGLTEYVLIIAFIAGIAFMMFSGNGSLKGTVADTLTETVRILAGLFDEKVNWGNANPDTFNSSNSAERLAADQKALENLAYFFIGKTKKEVKELLTVTGHAEGYSADSNYQGGELVTLGYFQRDANGELVFTSDYIRPQDVQHMLNWMQGDYGEGGNYTATSLNNYLVSDYAVSQGLTSGNSTEKVAVQMRLLYTENENLAREVVGAQIAIDPGNQQQQSGSSGLEIKIEKGKEPIFVDTGLTNDWKYYVK